MINLLPPSSAELVIRDYRQRRRTVAAWLLLFLLAVGLVLVWVFYFTLLERRVSLAAATEVYRNQAAVLEFKNLSTELRAATDKLTRLREAGQRAVPLTPFVERLLRLRPPGIRLTEIEYRQTPAAGGVFTLIGQAVSRQQLLAFLERLRVDPAFSAVDSPVINLIRERDVTFRISLVAASTAVQGLVLP